MAEAVLDTVTAQIFAGDYQWRSNGQSIKFAGFMKIYIEGKDTEDEEDKEGILPELNEGEKVKLEKLEPAQHWTAPPPQFTEATLIKAMEENGIGRPSTYAPTIATITARGYVLRSGKTLSSGEIGVIVTELMEEYFSKILDISFTANMEEQLDQVAEEGKDWKSVLTEFYPDFKVALDRAEDEISKIEIKDEVSDIECDKCGRMMVYKLGRYGKFLACPGFPECRNIKSILVEAGTLCPYCGSKVIIRKTKRGKLFYTCEKGKECKLITWDLPTGSLSGKCGEAMVEKETKTKGKQVFCSNKDCEGNKAK